MERELKYTEQDVINRLKELAKKHCIMQDADGLMYYVNDVEARARYLEDSFKKLDMHPEFTPEGTYWWSKDLEKTKHAIKLVKVVEDRIEELDKVNGEVPNSFAHNYKLMLEEARK